MKEITVDQTKKIFSMWFCRWKIIKRLVAMLGRMRMEKEQ